MYQLSEFQHNAIVNCIKKSCVCFAVLEPSEKDDTDTATQFANECRQANELMELELLKDISDKFAERIEVSKANNNRAYKVYMLTDAALQMFATPNKRNVN